MPNVEEVNMDDFEGNGQARELRGWVLSPEKPGALKLVLQYGPASDTPGEGLVQLLLPPEAALHLADELNRQARRTLDEQAREEAKYPVKADPASPGGSILRSIAPYATLRSAATAVEGDEHG